MAGKGGIISFRVDANELACIRERARKMPRKPSGRLASPGDVVHRILREALQQAASIQGPTLEDVIKALDPSWSGHKPGMPHPVKAGHPDGKTPVEFYLESRR
jgi:hypothetical protein